jgi:hypothetical protein
LDFHFLVVFVTGRQNPPIGGKKDAQVALTLPTLLAVFQGNGLN